MKKIIIILAVFMVLLLPVTAFAEDTNNFETGNVITPMFKYIWSLSASLDINKWGKAECVGSVDASSDKYTAELTVSLQQYTGSSWKSIKSWSGSGSGQSGVIVGGYYYVGSGTYRVCSTAKIYNSSGDLLENESYCSAEKTY